MSSLTEEQRKRIEENRKKALAKRAAAVAARSCSTPFQTHPHADTSLVNSSGSVCSSDIFKKDSVSQLRSCNAFPKQQNQPDISADFSCAPTLVSNEHPYRPILQSSVSNTGNTKPVKSEVHSFYSKLGSNGVQASKTVPAFASHVNEDSSSSKTCNSEVQTLAKQLNGAFVLLSYNRFYVDVGYHKKMIDIFKTIPSRAYDAKTKKWNFSVKDHNDLVSKLRTLQPDVVFSSLPKNFIDMLSKTSPSEQVPEYDLSSLDPMLQNALLPFQKVGVNFGIQHGGKVLIADDMGLGKTIQAIAISSYYEKDWPLLVVTPSSVRYSWAEAFRTWLPSAANELMIINSGKDHIPKHKIILLSYDILTRKKEDILKRGFKSVIMDESHFLKNWKSARTKVAQQVMKSANRIIMLSGTPALSRPIELFPQITALNPKMFPDFLAFGTRYCNGRKMPWGWDFSGSSNMEELQLLLEATVMIRRLKSEVIKQLPAKCRQMIILDPSLIASKNVTLKAASRKMSKTCLKGMERRGVLLNYFHETGVAKVSAICEYIKDLLEANKKFLCFAHHQIVLDAICNAIEKAKVEYIRICGTTPSEQRKILCDKFQLKDSCKVAVLSITSANAGITLTAAHLVVFAELFWNPGILTQAEDRVHRIGQENSVVVQYLVAKGTADDEIWPLVQRKLNILNKAGLSKDNFLDADTVTVESSLQPRIEDFWQELENSLDSEAQIIAEDGPSKRTKLC